MNRNWVLKKFNGKNELFIIKDLGDFDPEDRSVGIFNGSLNIQSKKYGWVVLEDNGRIIDPAKNYPENEIGYLYRNINTTEIFSTTDFEDMVADSQVPF